MKRFLAIGIIISFGHSFVWGWMCACGCMGDNWKVCEPAFCAGILGIIFTMLRYSIPDE